MARAIVRRIVGLLMAEVGHRKLSVRGELKFDRLDDHIANARTREMERHLKIFISTIIFLVATSGYAEEYVQLEEDDPSVSAQELATERWMKMRQQPELTETSGTERRSVPIRKAVTSKVKASSKSKTSKNVKGSNTKESLSDAGKAPVEINKAVGEVDKIKSTEGAGKVVAPAGASKAKPSAGAAKAKTSDGVGKAKSLAGTGKATSVDDSTKPED